MGTIRWRRDRLPTPICLGFPCGSAGKESTCNAGDLGLIPGLGRFPGEGNLYIVHRVTKSWTRLSDSHFCFPISSSRMFGLYSHMFNFLRKYQNVSKVTTVLFIFSCTGSSFLCLSFLVVVSRGYPFFAVHKLLISVVCLVAEQDLCGTQTQQLWLMNLVAPQHVEYSLIRDQTFTLHWQANS